MENHDPRILPAVRHLVPPNELVGYHCDSKIAIILHSSLFSPNAGNVYQTLPRPQRIHSKPKRFGVGVSSIWNLR